MIRLLFTAAKLGTAGWAFGEAWYTNSVLKELREKVKGLEAEYKKIGVDLTQFIEFFQDNSSIIQDLSQSSKELGILNNAGIEELAKRVSDNSKDFLAKLPSFSLKEIGKNEKDTSITTIIAYTLTSLASIKGGFDIQIQIQKMKQARQEFKAKIITKKSPIGDIQLKKISNSMDNMYEGPSENMKIEDSVKASQYKKISTVSQKQSSFWKKQLGWDANFKDIGWSGWLSFALDLAFTALSIYLAIQAINTRHQGERDYQEQIEHLNVLIEKRKKEMPEIRRLLVDQGGDLPTLLLMSDLVKSSMAQTLNYVAAFPMALKKDDVLQDIANIVDCPSIDQKHLDQYQKFTDAIKPFVDARKPFVQKLQQLHLEIEPFEPRAGLSDREKKWKEALEDQKKNGELTDESKDQLSELQKREEKMDLSEDEKNKLDQFRKNETTIIEQIEKYDNQILEEFKDLEKTMTKEKMIDDLKLTKDLYNTLTKTAQKIIKYLNIINGMIAILKIIPNLEDMIDINTEDKDEYVYNLLKDQSQILIGSELSKGQVAVLFTLYSGLREKGKKTFLGFNLEKVYKDATTNSTYLTQEELKELMEKFKDYSPDESSENTKNLTLMALEENKDSSLPSFIPHSFLQIQPVRKLQSNKSFKREPLSFYQSKFQNQLSQLLNLNNQLSESQKIIIQEKSKGMSLTDIITFGKATKELKKLLEIADGKIPPTRQTVQSLIKDINYFISISLDLYNLGNIIKYFFEDSTRLLVLYMVLPDSKRLDFNDQFIEKMRNILFQFEILTFVVMLAPGVSGIASEMGFAAMLAMFALDFIDILQKTIKLTDFIANIVKIHANLKNTLVQSQQQKREIEQIFKTCSDLIQNFTKEVASDPGTISSKLLSLQSQTETFFKLYNAYSLGAKGNFDSFQAQFKTFEKDVVIGDLHGHDFFIMMWANDHYKDKAERTNFLQKLQVPVKLIESLDYLNKLQQFVIRNDTQQVQETSSEIQSETKITDLVGSWDSQNRDDLFYCVFEINRDYKLTWYMRSDTIRIKIPRNDEWKDLEDLQLRINDRNTINFKLSAKQSVFKEDTIFVLTSPQSMILLVDSDEYAFDKRQ